MSKSRLNRVCGIACLGLVSIAIACQCVGLFYPAWIAFSMVVDVHKPMRTLDLAGDDVNIQDVNMDANIGLWTINACYKPPSGFPKRCVSVTIAELQRMIHRAGNM